MTAYTFIAGAWLDPFELICSLRERMGLFGENKRGRRLLPSPQWPEVENMLGRIERLGEQMFEPVAAARRVYLEMLDAGAIMAWRALDDDIARETVRFILPITGNPGCWFYSIGQAAQPVPGQLIACNTRIPHSSANFGDCPRIVLVIDARPRTKE